MSNAKEQLRTLLAAYETALNAGDAGRIEQLYAEDGVFMPAGFATASGRKAVRGAYDAVFSNIRIAIHFTVDELAVKGDVAYALTHSSGTATVVATEASGPEANRELFVFARGGGARTAGRSRATCSTRPPDRRPSLLNRRRSITSRSPPQYLYSSKTILRLQ